MSTNEHTPLSQPTSAVRNTLGREQAPQNLVRPVSNEDLREYCDKNYHQILPIIAKKLHQEKAQQEKLKAVKARLNFKEASSESPEQRRGRSKSPREKGPERRTVFKRLKKGVFHRLGDKEKNVSAHSRKHRHKIEYSRRTKAVSESKGSAGGHWKSKPKKQKSSMEDDLSQPWVCEETDPFTPRICYFDFPKTRMPSHIKTYDGSEDPKDHLKIFQAAAKTKRWTMPTWCHMFNSTLTGNARVWFDDLPKESIDSYDDLRKAFLENCLQQKKCIKDPVEIHNIKQRNGESTEEFVRRYKLECRDVKGAPKCMKISGFMHGITNPELIKRLHDKIPKSMDEMMSEAGQKQNFKRGNFCNEQRMERKQDRFTLLTKTPREILALDKGKFKPPPPMTTPVEKRMPASFVSFIGRKDQAKIAKKGETSGKDKPLAVLMVQTWQKIARQRITQTFFLESVISFPTLGEKDGTKGPMIIEADMGGHCVHRIYVDGGSSSEILYEHCFSKFRPEIKNQLILANTPLVGFSEEILWPLGQISLLVRVGDDEHSTSAWMNFIVVRSPSPYNGIIGRLGVRKIRAIPSTSHEMIKFPVAGGIVTLRSSKIIPLKCSMVSEPEVPRSAIDQVREEKIQVAIHREHPEQTVAIGSTLTEEGRKELCGLLRRHLDVFAWKPADMTGVPWHIAEHRLNLREGCLPVRQKKRGQAPERNKAISDEVKKLVEAGIMKEVHYHSWLSNPVMVESLCGYPYKCFLDGYKGYHQIKMAEEDEEKTTFITSQGIFCYSKIPFGLKNAGATYQRLVDKAFQKQRGRNLKVYMDDLVIKSRMKKEVIRDTEETFKTLRKKNMKLNPKKCAFGMREGTFLGYKVDAGGLRVSPNKVKAVLDLPSPKCLKDVQKLNRKLAKAEEAFKEMKQSIAKLLMLTTPKEKEELIMYLAAAKEAINALLMTERDGKQVPVYFVSRALQGPEINYTPLEKLILALRFELGEHDIQYRSRTSVKGQILADFIVERLEDGAPDTPMEDREELLDPWILFTGGSSCVDGSGAGLIIMNLEGMEFTYAQREKEIDEKEILAVVEEEGHTWMTPVYEYLMERILPEEKKESKDGTSQGRKICRDKRSVIQKILSWTMVTEKLTSITSPWPFYKWGIDIAGPFSEGPGKVEEVSHVLWAHRTMSKSSNGETPFSLTYGAKAVIPAEIRMPTLRTAEVDMAKNNEGLGISLGLLEEKREQAAIQEARNKAKMEGYYNVRVRSTSFRPRDFVYRNNEASHAEDRGKLGPKWEGPYEVTEALGKGAYRLRDHNGHTLS
uniref:Reverse transcriptase domain-containing protein n=1 Tax=Tanacetum cinerariifolium TaxID=118510 RepID=A0A699I7C3_TANCI|nr:reverse transcriptase domain-containing protein [Tanacetum cinerariifolium]